jgi:histidine triad (HIT) family protein
MKLRNASGDNAMQDCIFCKIINKEEPASITYEDQEFVILPSKFPAAEIHFLFIPKEHVQSIAHVEPKDQPMLGAMMMLASKFAAEQGIKDYKLIFNAGKYAKIPHLHLHLLAGELEDNT